MNDKKFQRIIKLALVGVLVIALCCAIIFFIQYKMSLKDPRNNVTYQNLDTELGINPNVAEQLKDYRCMVLYGVDGDGVSGVMIVASINWDTHQCKLVKIDAKTYMELDSKKTFVIKGKELSKFACGYTYSRIGLVSSMKMLNRHLDLPIREGIGMNLEAASTIVDELNGVDIEMTQSMCDEINKRFNHEGEIKLKDGKARLNGQQIIEYLATCADAYSIEDADAISVFKVFIAIIERAKENNEDNLLKILNTAVRGCDTNMSVKDLAVFVEEIDSYDVESTSNWPYEAKNKMVAGYQVMVPDTLSSNVSRLHKELFEQKNYKPTKTCERLSKYNK